MISNVREKLDNNEMVWEVMLRFPDVASAEIMANCGVDIIIIDFEHYAFNNETILNIVRAVHSKGKACGLRVPYYDEALISHYMDYGLDAILVPHVETAEQAHKIVEAVRFAPCGKRGFCPITKSANYGIGMAMDQYIDSVNKNTVIMLMVETKTGLDNIDSILKVDGIDVICIGPSDVSESLGMPGQVDHPLVKELIDIASKKVMASSVNYGMSGDSVANISSAIESRCGWLHISSDLQLLLKYYGDYVMRSLSTVDKRGDSLSFKEKLFKKHTAFTCRVQSACLEHVELMFLLGIDAIIIDQEHFAFDFQDIQNMVRVARGFNKTCIVKISKAYFNHVSLLLDMGIDGILLPNASSKEEVEALIERIKFAPKGKRGYCPICYAADYGLTHTAVVYPDIANKKTSLGVIIESKVGIHALDKILKMEDLDYVLIDSAKLIAERGGSASNEEMKCELDHIERTVLSSSKALLCTCDSVDDISLSSDKEGNLYQLKSAHEILNMATTEIVKTILSLSQK